MGTCIEAAATAHKRGHVLGRGALHLTDEAAIACLERAHHDADELDLLINTGIYKDGNAAEPALASIIQEDIGANAGRIELGHHGTFSFDVVNGGCGVLTAAQLIDGFVGPGSARLGMVVAADADPSPHTTKNFPFSPAGGAMILAHTDEDRGFLRFETRTYPEYATLFESRLHFDAHAGLLHKGRNVIEIYEAPAFAERATELAAALAKEILDEAGWPPESVDLVIASQYPPGFGKDVALALGIPAERVPEVDPALARAHTAGPIAALEKAFEDRRFVRAKHTLFVTVGAGITVSVALYRAR